MFVMLNQCMHAFYMYTFAVSLSHAPTKPNYFGFIDRLFSITIDFEGVYVSIESFSELNPLKKISPDHFSLTSMLRYLTNSMLGSCNPLLLLLLLLLVVVVVLLLILAYSIFLHVVCCGLKLCRYII